MIIKTETGSIDTDDLVVVERNPDLSVSVTLETPVGQVVRTFFGIAAQQVWAQVTEHSTTIKAL